MGDVVEFRRVARAEVRRFGHRFGAELRLGSSPHDTDPQVTISVDGSPVAWAEAEFLAGQWDGLVLDMEEGEAFLEPGLVGQAPASEDELDAEFLFDAEDYLLVLLREELRRLIAVQVGAETATPLTATPATRPSPRERALRVASLWHDHGQVADQLPTLVAIEISSAARELGLAVATELSQVEAEVMPVSDAADMVRDLVDEYLDYWSRKDSHAD